MAGMTLRHAPALALVGWYLMMPPWGKLNAPLSEWVIYQAFDSAEVCTIARKTLVDFQGNYKGMAMTLITQSGGNLQFDGSVATCIATDDPRLKGTRQSNSVTPMILTPARVESRQD